jgi:hypothetical protein
VPERTGWAPERDRHARPIRGAGREGPGASVISGQYKLEPEPKYFLLMKGNVIDVVPDLNPQPHTNNIRAKQVIINYSHLVLLFAFYFTTIY